MNSKSGKNIIVTIIGIVFQYLWQSQRTSTVRRYVFAVTIAGILLLTGQWSQAQTIYVEPCQTHWTAGTCGSEPYASLKCAVDAAAPGSTINLQCGNYMETLKIKKPLTLTASGGTARVGMQPDHLWAGVNNGDIFDVRDEPIGIVSPDKTLGAMLDILAASNLRVIRICIDYRLDLDDNGHAFPPGEYNDCILHAIDELMVEMQKRGLLLIITFEAANWMDEYLIYSNEDAKYYPGTTDNEKFDTWYSWRRCRTPKQLYQDISDHLGDVPESSDFEENQLCRKKIENNGVIKIYCKSPHRQRIEAGEFGEDYSDSDEDYFTNDRTKELFKMRVEHILNRENKALGKPWKDINDVIWAWNVYGEPANIINNDEEIIPWLNEMASHIKEIDPDTYLALGTMAREGQFLEENFDDIDIYTIHAYSENFNNAQQLWDLIRQFKSPQGIGGKYGKFLLIEEFDMKFNRIVDFENGFISDVFKVSNEMQVPCMIWEFEWDYRGLSIWPKRNTVPWYFLKNQATKLWNTENCLCGSASKPWRVGKMVDALSPK